MDHLQFLRRLTAFALARRETVGDGGSESLRGAAKEGGLLLLSLKLQDFGGELLPRKFNPPLPPFMPLPGSSLQPTTASTLPPFLSFYGSSRQPTATYPLPLFLSFPGSSLKPTAASPLPPFLSFSGSLRQPTAASLPPPLSPPLLFLLPFPPFLPFSGS